jgi:Rab9 effector protein with kelch motifs
MSSERRSPTITPSDFTRGDGTLTPVFNGVSPSTPYFDHPGPSHAASMSNLRVPSNGFAQNSQGHGHQPSSTSSASAVKSPSGPRNQSSSKSDKPLRSASDSAPGGSSGNTRSASTRERTSRNGRTPAHASSPALNGIPTVPSYRTRVMPHMPHAHVDISPSVHMYWSKAAVWGTMPNHGMRAHSVTLVDNVAWIFGGCDEKGCWKDVWLFNTGMSRHLIMTRVQNNIHSSSFLFFNFLQKLCNGRTQRC